MIYNVTLTSVLSLSPSGKQDQSSQILYTKRAALSSQASTSSTSSASSLPQGSPESRVASIRPAPIPSSPGQSQAAVRAREFAADLFRRAQGGVGGKEERRSEGGEGAQIPGGRRTNAPQPSTSAVSHSLQVMSPASSSSSPSSPQTPSSSQEVGSTEPGYVNYSRLQYRLQQPGAAEQLAGGAAGEPRAQKRFFSRVGPETVILSPGYEDDKVQLPFTVTDLRGRSLQLVTGPHSGQVGVARGATCRLSATFLTTLLPLLRVFVWSS